MNAIEATILIAKAFESKQVPGNHQAGLYRAGDELVIREGKAAGLSSRIIAVLDGETVKNGPTGPEWDRLTIKVQMDFERKPKCQKNQSALPT